MYLHTLTQIRISLESRKLVAHLSHIYFQFIDNSKWIFQAKVGEWVGWVNCGWFGAHRQVVGIRCEMFANLGMPLTRNI